MPEQRIRVGVNGALGRMGQTVLAAAAADPGAEAVGGSDVSASSDVITVPGVSGSLPLATSVRDLLDRAQADVIVDFTNGDGALQAMRQATEAGVHVVSGSTGIPQEDLARAGEEAEKRGVGIISAPNFALGAVLMMHLARIAGPHFEYADLVESHHEAKIDSPSGTAIAIAHAAHEGHGGDFERNVPEKETVEGTRGGHVGGVSIHSARMPGRMARHELVFGAQGQTFTLLHDSISRESFMPGVLTAVKRVVTLKGLMIGLDQVLGLGQPSKP